MPSKRSANFGQPCVGNLGPQKQRPGQISQRRTTRNAEPINDDPAGNGDDHVVGMEVIVTDTTRSIVEVDQECTEFTYQLRRQAAPLDLASQPVHEVRQAQMTAALILASNAANCSASESISTGADSITTWCSEGP